MLRAAAVPAVEGASSNTAGIPVAAWLLSAAVLGVGTGLGLSTHWPSLPALALLLSLGANLLLGGLLYHGGRCV